MVVDPPGTGDDFTVPGAAAHTHAQPACCSVRGGTGRAGSWLRTMVLLAP